jgi:hypothetical protein
MSNKILVKVGSLDLTPYISSYKPEYNVLVADTGRSALGNLRIQVVNRKVKLNITLRPLSQSELTPIFAALEPFAKLTVEYWDVKSGTQKTIFCYPSTLSPDMYWNYQQNAFYKDLSFSLIEL